MSTENKMKENRKGGNKKIVPIRFPYDTSDDPEIDDFILQNLQDEADEIERRMNADPNFAENADLESAQSTAPEERYEKIVARLKEMGEWEEDEDSSAEAETDGAGTESAGIEDAGVEHEVIYATGTGSTGTEAVYRMLSEDDRQALELGRKEQRRREKKKARGARLFRLAKRGGAVAAAFVLLFTVSMNVDASRRVILQMWDTVADAIAARTATDNLEDSVESTVVASLAAMEEIKEATGIPGLDFVYWPDGMEYLQYELQDENAEAMVFYSYDDSIVHLYMRNVSEDSTNYYMTDQDTELVKTMENWVGAKAEIWSVNSEKEGEQYLAEFEYETYRYVIYGYLPLEELEELIQGMDFIG